MKRWVAGLSATFVMALSGLVPQPVHSQSNSKWYFYCGKSANGLTATIVKQPNEREIVLIVWESKIWSSDTNLAAKERCETATKNFQEASEEGSLIYLTGTKVDDYPAICASKEEYGNCDKLLFTLRKEENVDFILEDLGYYRNRPSTRYTRDSATIQTDVQTAQVNGNSNSVRNTSSQSNTSVRNGRGTSGDSGTIQNNDQTSVITGNGNRVWNSSSGRSSRRYIDVKLWINNKLDSGTRETSSRNNSATSSRKATSPTKANAVQSSSVMPKYTQINFVCVQRKLISTTVLRTSQGDIPIIVWKSDAFASSGWTSEKRCQEVTNRFENLRQKSALNYITSGVINELPAICAVKDENKPCTSEGLLFTLGKDSDPQKILKQMFLSNSDIPVDDNGVGKRDGRDSVCLSRGSNGNCSGLLISAIEL